MSTIPEPASKFSAFWAAKQAKHRELPSEEVWFRLHRIRTRRPMGEDEAVTVWEAFVESHEGSPEAALGELVAVLTDAGMLAGQSKWGS